MSAEELLDEALRRARHGAPRPMPEHEARALVRSVLSEARAKPAPRPARWPLYATVAVAAVALVAVGLASRSPDAFVGRAWKHALPPAPVVPPEAVATSTSQLPSGDRLIASPGSHHEVVSTTEHRIVALRRGDVLFDVVPREGSFTVSAGDVSVQVLGTVFSVWRDADDVAVRVFEGRVEVARGDRVRVLEAGELWVSSGAAPSTEWMERSDEQWQRVAPTRAPAPAPRPRVTLAEAEAQLRAGDAAGALAAATSALRGRDPDPEWRLLRADALDGLGRRAEAARSYCAAAHHFADARRAQAGYAAATLHADLGDPEEALRCLNEGRSLAQGSAVEERALSLQLRLLDALGREGAYRAAAEAYLRRFPGTTTARSLRSTL